MSGRMVMNRGRSSYIIESERFEYTSSSSSINVISSRSSLDSCVCFMSRRKAGSGKER